MTSRCRSTPSSGGVEGRSGPGPDGLRLDTWSWSPRSVGRRWEALDRAIEYSKQREQGGLLCDKQGFTHKLIVPHVARLEACRSYIEYVSGQLDQGLGANGALNTEGAIAKYMSTESGNKAAEDAIQAHGGYGYTRPYVVEKVKRDVRITTIYEGTSEILEMTIARDRWQMHLKTQFRFYLDKAAELTALHPAPPQRGRRRRRAGHAGPAGDPGSVPGWV